MVLLSAAVEAGEVVVVAEVPQLAVQEQVVVVDLDPEAALSHVNLVLPSRKNSSESARKQNEKAWRSSTKLQQMASCFNPRPRPRSQ